MKDPDAVIRGLQMVYENQFLRVPKAKAVIQCPLNLYQSPEDLIAGPQNAEVLTQGARRFYQESYKL